MLAPVPPTGNPRGNMQSPVGHSSSKQACHALLNSDSAHPHSSPDSGRRSFIGAVNYTPEKTWGNRQEHTLLTCIASCTFIRILGHLLSYDLVGHIHPASGGCSHSMPLYIPLRISSSCIFLGFGIKLPTVFSFSYSCS